MSDTHRHNYNKKYYIYEFEVKFSSYLIVYFASACGARPNRTKNDSNANNNAKITSTLDLYTQ